MTMIRKATAALGLGAACLCGCAHPNNDRVLVGGEVPPALIPTDERGDERLVEATEPSLDGITRTHWDEMVIYAHPDGTQHHSRYTTGGPFYTDETGRQRGEYPTRRSALDEGAETGTQVKEAFAAPFHAGVDVLLFIPRLFVKSPGAVFASPAIGYSRYADPLLIPTMGQSPDLEADVAPIDDEAAMDEGAGDDAGDDR